MDTPKLPPKPAHLLDDLESIRALLDDEPNGNEPPLLTESLDADGIPLLSERVEPAPARPESSAQPQPQAAPATPAPAPAPVSNQPVAEAIRQRMMPEGNPELALLDSELRAAAQLILQDVIDDFLPQIEAELKRRLDARLTRLLPPRRP
ncbi:DNA polymerase III subunit chi [Pseudomonas sp. BN417]|uniref:DNA polymerase III subunit chi n=1 Tax=Pseudomonas sp. BN417 TaxID=2567890 RepID=UPI002457CB24|nr:DNA polymerase III subunit chi [Pseudomonas sp. BN417]MDH4555220.1 DNA polymerase III subunit chi [Pseudomonas sp. BN417]